MIGKTLGHFRILDRIGSGGMGEVYRAHDKHLDRDVALKVLPTSHVSDDGARRRFRKEALALAKLKHPHIGVVHDFGSEDGVDYLVMELIQGNDLSTRLKTGPLPKSDVVRLGMQIAEALEEAHENQIVHLDLKPKNVMVTPKGQAKVLDFGLSKLIRPVDEATTKSMNELRGVAGTLPYMAPEQLKDGADVDARTDVYALGVTLYEMATGKRPFDQGDPTKLITAILQSEPTRPGVIHAEISSELERVILKTLKKEPTQRYQTVRELREDLERCAAGISVSAPRLRPRWLSRTRSVIIISVVALVVLTSTLVTRHWLSGGCGVESLSSLAVLPLSNLTGDPGEESFVDGMTDALIGKLAGIAELNVVGRGSAMQLKNTDKSICEIASMLGVGAVVQASVMRNDDVVHMAVQLTEVKTDRALWGDTFVRDTAEIISVYNDVAAAIARAIGVTLSHDAELQLADAREVDPRAYRDYLRGLGHLRQWTPEGFANALQHLRQAIETDPAFALAYSGLADYYVMSTVFGHTRPTEARPKARAAINKALEYDPELAAAHKTDAAAKFLLEWDWDGAEQAFHRALTLVPNDPDLQLKFSLYLVCVGRFDEAIAANKRAIEIDPLTLSTSLNLGWVFFMAGRFDDSLEQLEGLLATDPDGPHIHIQLAWNYAAKGMYDKAITECGLATKDGYVDDVTYASAVWIHGAAGRTVEARRILMELLEKSRSSYVDPSLIAWAYDGLGDRDTAIEWFRKAIELGTPNIAIKVDPGLSAGLRADPRFQELLRRMGFD